MRLLADENIHGALVRWLRAGGHDVRYVAEEFRSLPDIAVLDEATKDGRFLITDDKDFGELAIRQQIPCLGIILFRLSSLTLKQRIAHLSRLWPTIEANALKNLVVVSDDKIRVRPLPHNG